MCTNRTIKVENRELCDSFVSELQNRQKIDKLVTRIKLMVGAPTRSRRGLVNAIGSISKVLFGTMDAEDERKISE